MDEPQRWVYLVTEGEGEDYHVVAVCTTGGLARQCAAAREASAMRWPLDWLVSPMRLKCYTVVLRMSTGELDHRFADVRDLAVDDTEIEFGIEGYIGLDGAEYRLAYGVSACGYEHAEELAEAMRRAYLDRKGPADG